MYVLPCLQAGPSKLSGVHSGSSLVTQTWLSGAASLGCMDAISSPYQRG